MALLGSMKLWSRKFFRKVFNSWHKSCEDASCRQVVYAVLSQTEHCYPYTRNVRLLGRAIQRTTCVRQPSKGQEMSSPQGSTGSSCTYISASFGPGGDLELNEPSHFQSSCWQEELSPQPLAASGLFFRSYPRTCCSSQKCHPHQPLHHPAC